MYSVIKDTVFTLHFVFLPHASTAKPSQCPVHSKKKIPLDAILTFLVFSTFDIPD